VQYDSKTFKLKQELQVDVDRDAVAAVSLPAMCSRMAQSPTNMRAAACQVASPQVVQHDCVVLRVFLKLGPDELQGKGQQCQARIRSPYYHNAVML
jgi:hypothetical protein